MNRQTRGGSPRRRVHVLLPLLLVLFLTSCRSTVTTTVTVDGSRADGTLVVSLAGEAAQALRVDPETDQRLLTELSRRSGSPVQRQDNGTDIIYRTSLPTGESNLAVTGVAVDSIVSDGGSSIVTLTFVQPTTLLEAMQASVADEPDATARSIVMTRSTDICADIRFPGTISSVSGIDAFEVERSERSVLICRTVESLSSPTVVTITGSSKSPIPYQQLSVVVLLAGVILVVLRRMSRGRSPR
jgi:hypothetical protein